MICTGWSQTWDDWTLSWRVFHLVQAGKCCIHHNFSSSSTLLSSSRLLEHRYIHDPFLLIAQVNHHIHHKRILILINIFLIELLSRSSMDVLALERPTALDSSPSNDHCDHIEHLEHHDQMIILSIMSIVIILSIMSIMNKWSLWASWALNIVL